MAAYADAWLGEGQPLAADAVTLSPYLGYESLRPALDLAAATGRGVFVLGLTSNPEGKPRCSMSAAPTRWPSGIIDAVGAENAGATARSAPPAWSSAPPSGSALEELGIDLAASDAPDPGSGPGRPGRHGRGHEGVLRRRSGRRCSAPPAATSSRPARTPAPCATPPRQRGIRCSSAAAPDRYISCPPMSPAPVLAVRAGDIVVPPYVSTPCARRSRGAAGAMPGFRPRLRRIGACGPVIDAGRIANDLAYTRDATCAQRGICRCSRICGSHSTINHCIEAQLVIFGSGLLP